MASTRLFLSDNTILTKDEAQNLLDMYWSMLRNLESNAKPEDTLDRYQVESAYMVWNRIYNTKLKPTWQK